MRGNAFALLAVALLTSSCLHHWRQASTKEAVNYDLKTPFDEALTRHQLRPGSARIEGSAFLRQQGGGVVTCAGYPILLIPVTPYSRERMSYKLQTDPILDEIHIIRESENREFERTFTPYYPLYDDLVKTAVCNAQGEFVFDGLASGEYFIKARVVWRVGDYQGGVMYAKVKAVEGVVIKRLITYAD
jgi:hypothetical protein